MDISSPTVSPLRQRMLGDMRMRKMAEHTQDGYIRAVRKLAAFLGRSPATATIEELRRSAFAVACGLLQSFYGPMGDRYGRLRIIPGASVFGAIVNLGVAKSPTLRAAVVWRAIRPLERRRQPAMRRDRQPPDGGTSVVREREA